MKKKIKHASRPKVLLQIGEPVRITAPDGTITEETVVDIIRDEDNSEISYYKFSSGLVIDIWGEMSNN
jgi:hypothetical protein